MKPKVHVGMRLFSLAFGRLVKRYDVVPSLTPVTVTKVGRKYFTVSLDPKSRFGTEHRVEDWSEKTDYTASTVLYESEQQWADEKESCELCGKISNAFHYGRNNKNLNLEKLRLICGIIDSN